MIKIYQKYTPRQLKEELGWAEGLDVSELTAALMVTLDMINHLENEIEKLKADTKHANDTASMLANGIQPD